MFQCTRCQYESRDYYNLISHYRFVHSNENDFFLICGVDGCEKKYTLVKSLLQHTKRRHKNFHDEHLARWRHQNREPAILNTFHPTEGNDLSFDNTDQTDDDHVEGVEKAIDFDRNLAIFLLKLREKFKLPASAIVPVVDEISNMIESHHALLSRHLIELLNNIGLSEENLSEVKSLLSQSTEVESTCKAFNSEHRLNKYVEENFGFVKPDECRPNVLPMPNRKETYQYIPVLDTLKSLLNHDDVFAHILNSHQSQDGVLRDICDGKAVKNNPFFKDNDNALQIILFFDEFTVANPLGTRVKNYKICGFYLLLANLPPRYRAQLHIIQLVMLCMSNIVKKYGFTEILKPLLHDLRILESEGIVIHKPDRDYTIHGSVVCLVADNLGAHALGGFMECFTTLRNCRFCFVTREDMRSVFECGSFQQRTIEMYEQQVNLVQRDNTLSRTYGLKSNSPLNNLENFHVVNGSPSDIAHDLFEGVVCEVVKNVIIHCVSSGYFSLQLLNTRLSQFSFSEVDKSNKPCSVPLSLNNFSVKQTAAQMWCFVRFLPLWIGDKVPIGDAKWETLLLLRDMLLYICAPALDQGHLQVMKDVIEDFHESYRENFPQESVKPKFHFTLHYPEETLQFGPLIHIQTLRFEGKHNYFKELVYRTKNKRNICKTLAKRHQYMQCLHNASDKYLSDSGLDTACGGVLPVRLLLPEVQALLRRLLVNEEQIFQSKSVTHHGIKYTVGNCIIIDCSTDLIGFARIEHCFSKMDTTPLRFLVISCGDRTKKVGMTNNLSCDQIKDIFRQRFDISEFFIQVFDSDCQEWIDLEEESLETVRDESNAVVKLRAVKTSGQPDVPFSRTTQCRLSATTCNPTTTSPSPTITESGRASPNISPSPTESGRESTSAFPSPTESGRESTSASPVSSARRSTSTPNDKRVQELPQQNSVKIKKGWPKLFSFPRTLVSRTTMMKLDEQRALDKKDMKIILDAIYTHSTQFQGGLYPSPDMYDSIVDGIFRDFPYLARIAGLPTASSRMYWKDKIIFKFGNSRRRVDSELPEVQAKKKKGKTVGSSEKEATPVYTWGMAKYCPPIPSSEDEASLQTHKEWLQREYSKTSHEVELVDLKMDLTFPTRRQQVVKDQAGVKEVLREFPWLRNHRQLLLEFTRLKPNCNQDNLEDAVICGLKKYGLGIIKLATKKKAKYVADIQEQVVNFRTESQRNHGNYCSALIGIICLFKEKPQKIIQINQDGNVTDGQVTESGAFVIKCKGTSLLDVKEAAFQLEIEGEVITEAETFLDIFLALVACIYSFNLVYPKCWEKSLLFLQNVILNLKDGNTIDRRLISTLADINKEL